MAAATINAYFIGISLVLIRPPIDGRRGRGCVKVQQVSFIQSPRPQRSFESVPSNTVSVRDLLAWSMQNRHISKIQQVVPQSHSGSLRALTASLPTSDPRREQPLDALRQAGIRWPGDLAADTQSL